MYVGDWCKTWILDSGLWADFWTEFWTDVELDVLSECSVVCPLDLQKAFCAA